MAFEKKFNIALYNNQKKQDWDLVVSQSKNGNFLHFRDYIEYHAERFKEESLVIYQGSTPVAVFPCNIIDDTAISHSGLTYGGLIYGKNVRALDAIRIIEIIINYFKEVGIKKIQYKAIPHVFHNYPSEEDIYALFLKGFKLFRRDMSSAVPLDKPIKLTDSRKNTIKKAINFNLRISESENFSEFYNLLEANLLKFKKKPTHSLSEIMNLKKRFPNNIKLFTASKFNKIFSGAIIYDFGNTIHTQYLSSSSEGQKIGALDFLLYTIISELFKDRKYLSFGISTENNGRVLNEGLIFYKEGFGGRGIVHDFYELDFK